VNSKKDVISSGDNPFTNPALTNRLKETASIVTTYDIFSQLLGIALRSDIPLALDLLPCFWKSLLNLPLDPHDNLRETDVLTYNYLRRFSEVSYSLFKMLRKPCCSDVAILLQQGSFKTLLLKKLRSVL